MNKKITKRRKKDYEDDLLRDDQLDDDDNDEYDDGYLDEGPGPIVSLLISIMTILCVCAIVVAGAYFFSGINIVLRGDEVVEVPVFSEYEDRGATANFDFIKDVSWSIETDSNVDTNVVGEYQVVYTAEYHYWKAEKIRTVKVIDNRCPIIKLKGGRKVTWSSLDRKDPGYKAKDNYDGNLTDQVEVVTEVSDDGNTAKMTYTVTDSSGNVGMSVRHIFLKDVIPPTLELEGALRVEIPYGGQFVELGYKAYDDLDGDLTSKVMVSPVNPTKPGEQTILYSVTDSSGNTVTDSRTIVVGPKPVVKTEDKKDDKKDDKNTSSKTDDKKKNN